jgi:CRISPR system Cascade subunit CasE
MYLSCLLIDVGDNPDRPRPGRLWLRNLYHVHQRLCMAFPSDPRKKRDPDFLAPYDPCDFPEQHHFADCCIDDIGDSDVLKQVHAARNKDAGFLFRIDPHPNGRAVILVQSATWPDWDYAFHNAPFLAACEVKKFAPDFTKGQRLRFRLAANPMKKIGTLKKEERQSLMKEELKEKKGRHGRRVPVPNNELCGWLIRRAEGAGFFIDEKSTTIQVGYVYVNKTRDDDGEYWEINATNFALSDGSCKFCKQPKITPRHNCLDIKIQRSGERGLKERLRSVRYEGVLEVIDPTSFKETLIRGIGSGKAFGFGLLSVAPLPEEAR